MNQISLVADGMPPLNKMNTHAMTPPSPYFVSLPTIVQLMMASYEPDARAKGRSVYSAVGDSVPPLMTDKQRIRQVVDNYTYNAIKYAATNVRIVVLASAPFSRSEAAHWAQHGSSELGTVSSTTAGLEHPPRLPSVGSGQRRTTSGSTVYANVFSAHDVGGASGGSGEGGLASHSYEGHAGGREHLSGASQVAPPPASVGAALQRGDSRNTHSSGDLQGWSTGNSSPEQQVGAAAFDEQVAAEQELTDDAADAFIIKSNPAPGARTVTEGHPTPVVTPLSASPGDAVAQLDLPGSEGHEGALEHRSASAERLDEVSDDEGGYIGSEGGGHGEAGSVSTVGGSHSVAAQTATVESAMRFCGWEAPPLPPSHVMALGRQFAPGLPSPAPLCAEGAAEEEEDGTPSAEDVFVYVLIEVLDDGRGITPHVASKLFRPFVQEQDVAGGGMSEAGTGLGLAIVHELATLFHGKAFVVSTPGEGSSFRFLFPARLPRDSDAPAGHSLADMLATVAGAGMTVNATPASQAVSASVTSAAAASPPTVPSEASSRPPVPPPALGGARSDSQVSGASGRRSSVSSHGGVSTAWISELEATPPDATAGQLLSIGSPRVLLVDDAVINRKLQGKWLKKLGVPPENVFHAANGEQAVACVWQGWCAGNPVAAAAAGVDVPGMRAQIEETAAGARGNKQLHRWIPGPVDVVILDMGMEPGNGYSVVRELRRMFMALLLVAAGEHAAATALVQPVPGGTASPNGFTFPDPMPSTVVAGVAAPVPHLYDFPAWTCVPPLPRASRVTSATTSHSTAVSRGLTGGAASRHSSAALTHVASSNALRPTATPSTKGGAAAEASVPQGDAAAAAGGSAADGPAAPRLEKPVRSFKFPVFGNARAQPSEQRVLDVMCPPEGTGALPAVVKATLRAVGHPTSSPTQGTSTTRSGAWAPLAWTDF